MTASTPHEHVERIDAITLVTADMAAAVAFWTAAGFAVIYGGEPDSPFTTLRSGACHVNITAREAPEEPPGFWGRVIFHVDDVDALHDQLVAAGYRPRAEPRDAPWGERMFPINDPDGHDISFARPLAP